MYIDDIATLTVDAPGNARRTKEAVPLTIHATGRPQSKQEHLPRDNLVSMSKFSAEGTPAEETVALPVHKFTAWSEIFDNIITKGAATHEARNIHRQTNSSLGNSSTNTTHFK